MDRRCEADRDFARLERMVRGELDDAARSEAETHLAGCATCEAERAAILRDRMLLAEGVATPETPHAARAHEIVAGARHARRDARKLRRAAFAVVAAGVLVVIGGALGGDAGVAEAPTLPRRAERSAQPATPAPSRDRWILPNTTITLTDGTRIGTDRGASARVLSENLVVVLQGRVEFDVARRTTPFEVDAPDLRVTVHGTRFVVTVGSGPTRVRVLEGRVEVRPDQPAPVADGEGATASGRSLLLGAGDSYPSSVDPRPRPTAELRDLLAEAREHLAARRYAEARAALVRHMAGHPGDVDARYLLGEAQRLGGDIDGAEATYELLVAAGRGRVAENALARLAIVGQRRGPEAAVAAWQRYLTKHPRGTFAAEGLLHRANGLVSLGRREEARAALEQFLRDFPDHPRRAEVEERIRTGR